eukprot:9148798-Alexandrium_andersonii.AAC.1
MSRNRPRGSSNPQSTNLQSAQLFALGAREARTTLRRAGSVQFCTPLARGTSGRQGDRKGPTLITSPLRPHCRPGVTPPGNVGWQLRPSN